MRREQPHNRRASEQRDELAPPHIEHRLPAAVGLPLL
jgi:hypothetical protein